MFYKKFILTNIPNNFLVISTNIIEEFPTFEHSAFAVAFNIVDFFTSIKLNNSIEKDFIDFFEKIVLKNYNYFNGKYNEDLNLILEDIKRTKDLKSFVVVNPFLNIIFLYEIENLKDILKEKQTENNIRKISLVVDLLSQSGIEMSKVSNFDFNKINYQILDIVYKFNFRLMKRGK